MRQAIILTARPGAFKCNEPEGKSHRDISGVVCVYAFSHIAKETSTDKESADSLRTNEYVLPLRQGLQHYFSLLGNAQ